MSRNVAILSEIARAISNWPSLASDAKVDEEHVRQIQRAHRLSFRDG